MFFVDREHKYNLILLMMTARMLGYALPSYEANRHKYYAIFYLLGTPDIHLHLGYAHYIGFVDDFFDKGYVKDAHEIFPPRFLPIIYQAESYFNSKEPLDFDVQVQRWEKEVEDETVRELLKQSLRLYCTGQGKR